VPAWNRLRIWVVSRRGAIVTGDHVINLAGKPGNCQPKSVRPRVRENSVQFHRDESTGWRQVIPPEMVPKLEIVINNLAGSPVPGGK
jgi:hypothetical protein